MEFESASASSISWIWFSHSGFSPSSTFSVSSPTISYSFSSPSSRYENKILGKGKVDLNLSYYGTGVVILCRMTLNVDMFLLSFCLQIRYQPFLRHFCKAMITKVCIALHYYPLGCFVRSPSIYSKHLWHKWS